MKKLKPGDEVALIKDVPTINHFFCAGELFTIIYIWLDGIGQKQVKLNNGLTIQADKIQKL